MCLSFSKVYGPIKLGAFAIYFSSSFIFIFSQRRVVVGMKRFICKVAMKSFVVKNEKLAINIVRGVENARARFPSFVYGISLIDQTFAENIANIFIFPSTLGWVCIILYAMAYNICSSCGIYAKPWVLLCEFFPLVNIDRFDFNEVVSLVGIIEADKWRNKLRNYSEDIHLYIMYVYVL